MKYLLGLDAGTTAVKGVLFNEGGKSIARGICEYNLETAKPDFIELNPSVYWQASKNVIKQILKKSRFRPEKIKALSISSQGETLIFLDKKGSPIRKAVVWFDNRSQKEAKIVEKEIGREKIFRIFDQELVHRIAARDEQRQAVTATPARAPGLLPGAGDRARVTDHDARRQIADIDAQLQRVGGDHAHHRALAQTALDLPPQLGQVTAAVAGDELGIDRLTLFKAVFEILG